MIPYTTYQRLTDRENHDKRVNQRKRPQNTILSLQTKTNFINWIAGDQANVSFIRDQITCDTRKHIKCNATEPRVMQLMAV